MRRSATRAGAGRTIGLRPGAVRLAASMVLLIAGLSASPQAAHAALDANCPGPSNDTDSYPVPGAQRVAQTFTAANTGAVVRAEIEISKTTVTADDWLLQILGTDGAGAPTNSVLASASVPDSSVPGGISQLVGHFAPAAGVEAGQRYALALSRPGGGTFGVRERTGNPCVGQEFESPSQSGPWTPASDTGEDIVFATFVEPDCDRDELGDETQDASLFGGSCPTRGRALTLETNKKKVKRGRKVVLSGRLSESVRAGECQSGQSVVLLRKKPRQSTFDPVAELQTDAQGSFSTKRKVKKTYEYRAEVAASPGCAAGLSNTEKVKVKKE